MYLSYARLLSWGLALATILVFITVAVVSNRDGIYMDRTCVEFSGPTRTDPRTGEGPECDRYEMVAREESPSRTVIRGFTQGIMPAIIIGVLGLFLGDKLDERIKKR